MSLRTIHVFVIVCSIALLLGFGVLGFNYYGIWSQISLALGVLLVPYLYWFISKLRQR